MMKRGQLLERNRLHRELNVQHPIAPLDQRAQEQSSTSINFGVTTRKLRFTRASSRNYSAEFSLEEMCNRVPETYSTLHRALPGELALDLAARDFTQRAPLSDFEMLENSTGSREDNRSVFGASDRVLRSSQTRVSSSAMSAKDGLNMALQIYRGDSPGIGASVPSLVDDSSQEFSSPVLRKAASGKDTKQPQHGLGIDDRGKENHDPHGVLDGKSRRSPLPEWYRRKPLQDITNVLAAGLGDDQQPQPKKKLKKKVVSVAAPSFPTLSETPTRRKESTITQPKCSSFATPKQFSNLGKNFR